MKAWLWTGAFIIVPVVFAQVYTRGVGVYPGDPREDFSPQLRLDKSTYRNLALHRAAYQSSSFDYNLTAQLITDGIVETSAPHWLSVSTSRQGLLPRNERESLLDDNFSTGVELSGKDSWVQFEVGGEAPRVDRLEMDAVLRAAGNEPQEWSVQVLSSKDGTAWSAAGSGAGRTLPTGEVHASVRLDGPLEIGFLRLQFHTGRQSFWSLSEIRFFNQNSRVRVGGPFNFSSAWMSAGSGEEWVYVDLGATCNFDRVKLSWIRPPADGALQVSDDAKSWTTLRGLDPGSAEVRLPAETQGRYVRVAMKRAVTPTPYILSEMEVFGRGGPVAEAKPQPGKPSDGRIDLAGGGWRVERSSVVSAEGAAISETGFDDHAWIPATVPGTVLASYYNAGAVPDPNYGDNIFAISDAYFYSDFWYRDKFIVSAPVPGKHIWLNFDGINWKAEVFLNGKSVGRIDGGFIRGCFDVTSYLHAGQENVLAVRIEKNATPGTVREKTWDSPGKNGGALGADNPTYHASIGWDWIPTVRGRNTGIWSSVYLSTTGGVKVEDPYVATNIPLPDTSSADVTIEATLHNLETHSVSGRLRGRFGDIPFEQTVNLEASSEKKIRVNGLHLTNPKLWWPNGYGEPNLYDVQLQFETDGGVSDDKNFKAGVRQFTYKDDGGTLKIWINGRRFIPKGGNWGFPEVMLRYRAREYNAAMAYHQDMNFNMVRDWVGQVGDDPFYDAADRHGIVVWQDFWLANPWDGPDPNDGAMFMRNARDRVLRIRNHASIGLYCGRNEGFPPEPLEQGFRRLLGELHPGIEYIPSSADDFVSGHGPYQAMPTGFYFRERATTRMHSELGMPNIMNLESLLQTMPEEKAWPQGRMWGLHDFSLHGAQGGESFLARVDHSYGSVKDLSEWIKLAQFVNYEGYRAMFEAQSRNRMGLLIWMSHPAWPSLVWDTYDYFFDTTAAYYGAKKASEPLHVQWNPLTNSVEVVNYSAGNLANLEVRAQVVNSDGSVKWEKTVALDSREDSTVSPLTLEFPGDLTPVHFVSLELRRGDEILSRNLYWRGAEEDNFRGLRDLPKATVVATTSAAEKPDELILRTQVRNTSTAIALMVRIKAVREKSGDRILPAIYSDNYLTLMPGEQREVIIRISKPDTRGEKAKVILDGFNLR